MPVPDEAGGALALKARLRRRLNDQGQRRGRVGDCGDRLLELGIGVQPERQCARCAGCRKNCGMPPSMMDSMQIACRTNVYVYIYTTLYVTNVYVYIYTN